MTNAFSLTALGQPMKRIFERHNQKQSSMIAEVVWEHTARKGFIKYVQVSTQTETSFRIHNERELNEFLDKLTKHGFIEITDDDGILNAKTSRNMPL